MRLKVGDKVKWINTTRRGGALEMTEKTGELVEINGNTATVKYGRNHRKKIVLLDRLQSAEEKGHLTVLAEVIFEERRNKNSNRR